MRFLHISHYLNLYMRAHNHASQLKIYVYNRNSHFGKGFFSFSLSRFRHLLFVSLMIKFWRSKDERSVKTDTDRKKKKCSSVCCVHNTLEFRLQSTFDKRTLTHTHTYYNVHTQNFIKSLMGTYCRHYYYCCIFLTTILLYVITDAPVHGCVRVC